MENQLSSLGIMLRAKKSFGQNFLVDKSVIESIVNAVSPREDETLIEIGPGRGALTDRLIGITGRLIAVEVDRDLIPLLRKRFGASKNFTLVEGDALSIDLCSSVAPAPSARLVANLPYYISTAILKRLLEQRACLSEMTLMLQREVANRIMAAPSASARGFLSVLVQAYADVDGLFDVAPTAFSPEPKVWSTVVRLKLHHKIVVDVTDEPLLWRLVSAGFAQRRKTLFNNLRTLQDGPLGNRIETVGGVKRVLEVSGIDPRRRAETLDLEEWALLSRAIESVNK